MQHAAEQIGESDGDCSLPHDRNTQLGHEIGERREVKTHPFEEHSPDVFHFAES